MFLRKDHLLRCWGLNFSSKLDLGPYIISVAKTASKKIGALIHSMKFLSHEVALHLYKSTIGPCMDTVVMSGLVLLVATWNCWMSYNNADMQDCWSLSCCLS